jgi:hypothetical protein
MRMGKSAHKRYMAFVNAKRHRLSKRQQVFVGARTIAWTVGFTFYTVPIDKHSASKLPHMARYMCGRRSFLSPWGSLVDYFRDSSRMDPPFYLLRHNKAKQKEFKEKQYSLRSSKGFRSEKKNAEHKNFLDNILGE